MNRGGSRGGVREVAARRFRAGFGDEGAGYVELTLAQEVHCYCTVGEILLRRERVTVSTREGDGLELLLRYQYQAFLVVYETGMLYPPYQVPWSICSTTSRLLSDHR